MHDSSEERIRNLEREAEKLEKRSKELLIRSEKMKEAIRIWRNVWTDQVQTVSVRGPYPVALGQQMPFPCPACSSRFVTGEMVYTLGIKATEDQAGKHDVTALVSFHQLCWDASDENSLMNR